MSFEKLPSGTRGRRGLGRANGLTRFVQRIMVGQHRRAGDKFMGMDVLYLSTRGAKTGEQRMNPVAYFADGPDAWLIVASGGGTATHPSWYHNIAAHPDDVWIEAGGQRFRVTPDQLEGDQRAEAWQRITESQPRFTGYQTKTDRVLPVLRLTRAA